MVGPDHAVHIARYLNEQPSVCELLDGPLDDLSDLDVANLDKLLLDDGRLHRKLHNAVERVISSHAGPMDRGDPPRARRGG